jgi:hypothetical protein
MKNHVSQKIRCVGGFDFATSIHTFHDRLVFFSRSLHGPAVTSYLGPSSPYQVEGHHPILLSAYGTPTIDGLVSGGEWPASGCVGSSAGFGTETATVTHLTTTYTTTTVGTLYAFTFCHQNDQQYDYYMFRVNDQTQDPTDAFYILFDNDHSGTIAACAGGPGGEDALAAEQTSVGFNFVDYYYCSPTGSGSNPPWNVLVNDFVQSGGQQNVQGAAVYGSGAWVFELSKPLTGDSVDYSLTTSSVLGWCLAYRDGSTALSVPFWDFPVDCYVIQAPAGDASKYGDIQKLPGGEPTTTLTVTSYTYDGCTPESPGYVNLNTGTNLNAIAPIGTAENGPDPDWMVVSAPGNPPLAYSVNPFASWVGSAAFPHAWVGPLGNRANWITPYVTSSFDPDTAAPTGVYVYEIIFSGSGTLVIDGIASDDSVALALDSVVLMTYTGASALFPSSPGTAYPVATSGTHTLRATVTNTDRQTGLLFVAQFCEGYIIPEFSTTTMGIVLIVAVLAVLALVRRFRLPSFRWP